MKLAIALNDSQVHEFFGSCNTYLIVTHDNGQVCSTETVFNDTDTHKKRPAYLKQLGVNALVIKSLGLTAYDLLIENGITVYACDSLPVDQALSLYLSGQLPLMKAPEGAHC